jgi:hypothetical protein
MKVISIGRFKILKSSDILLAQKIGIQNKIYIKFDRLQEFNMENKLNNLNYPFLT